MDSEPILDLTFSGVRPDEATAVIELIQGAGLPVADLSPEKLRHFILMRQGPSIVGAVGLEVAQADALLRSLVVAESHRRRRVATRLVEAIERYARGLGVQRLFLLTQTAEGFFRRRGYAPTPRAAAPQGLQDTAEFRQFCPASAACLSKALGAEGATGD